MRARSRRWYTPPDTRPSTSIDGGARHCDLPDRWPDPDVRPEGVETPPDLARHQERPRLRRPPQDLVEPTDVRASSNGDGHPTGLSPTNPGQTAGFGEPGEDIRGVVLERVGGIVASFDYPSMAAAVGINATPDKVLGVAFDHVSLPRLEYDRPRVLQARPVLREQRGPTLEIRGHDHPGAVSSQPHSPPRQEGADRCSDPVDCGRVVAMQVDLKSPCARHPAEVAVTEIRAEQIAVGAMVLGRRQRRVPRRPRKGDW